MLKNFPVQFTNKLYGYESFKRRTRIIIQLIIVTLFLISISACNSSESKNNTDQEKYVPNTDPTIYDGLLDEHAGDFLGVYTEYAYDQIVATSIKDIYSLQQDSVFSCKISNQNIGHGFYIYDAAYIEKYIDGEWVRQCNKQAIDEQTILSWSFIGEEAGTDKIFSAQNGIGISNIYPEVTPGTYRLVVFTPKSTLYAEFEVQE